MRKILAIVFLFALSISCHAQQVNGRATTAAPSYTNATSAPLSLDLSGNLRTAIGALGTFNNNADNVATSAINGQVGAWNYIWDGAAWDRMPGTSTFGAFANIMALNGTAVDTNSGVKSAGTLRVVLATDQPQLTNKLLVTPDSVALPANQSVNVAQIAATTTDTNSGNKSAGTQRTVLATDSPAIALYGHGATAAAVPANATLQGVRSGANMVAMIQADTSVQLTMSTATTTQFVALSGSTKIYVTSFDFIAAGTTNVSFVTGTGANCASGQTTLAGVYTLTAQAGIAKGSGLGPVLVVPAAQALCVTNSQAIVIGGSISYTQF